ncbi:hypothetical protein BU17DRAFT_66567 [Hysterangium stoloniferum]|nr:hypothetical protein BU17DRAFT_66567 [Hysterangium stoloniferum]
MAPHTLCSSHTRYLRIERFPEDCVPATKRKRFTVQASPLGDSLKTRGADDRVFTVSGWPKGDTILERVNVKKNKITLHDLAIAAWVMRASNDDYQLLKKQCYWYSDMVIRVFEKEFSLNVDRSGSSVEQMSAGGTWAGIPVYKVKEERVEVVAAKFREERDRINNMEFVWRLITGDRSGKYESEVKLSLENVNRLLKQGVGKRVGKRVGKKVGKRKEQSLLRNEKDGRLRESNCWRYDICQIAACPSSSYVVVKSPITFGRFQLLHSQVSSQFTYIFHMLMYPEQPFVSRTYNSKAWHIALHTLLVVYPFVL